MTKQFQIINGDCAVEIPKLPDNSIDVVFTSPNPPNGQYERNLLVNIFFQLYPKLKSTGNLWVEMRDYHDSNGSYESVPQLFEIEMKLQKWLVRDRIIWHDPLDYPREDYTRCRRDYGFVFRFTKNMEAKWYGNSIVDESSVWEIKSEPVKQGEFSSGFPKALINRCLTVTAEQGDTVLDPFCETGTTGIVAMNRKLDFIGIEIDSTIIGQLKARLSQYGKGRN